MIRWVTGSMIATNNRIHLGPFTFHNYDEAHACAHDILVKYKKDETITDTERDYMIEVLKLRGPEGLKKIGVGIKRIYIDCNKFETLCFHLERVDGSTDDFSYKKCFLGKVDIPKIEQKPQVHNESAKKQRGIEKPVERKQADEKLAQQVNIKKPSENKLAQSEDFFSPIIGKKITLRFVGGGQPVTGTLEKYNDQGLIVRCAGKGQLLVLKHNIIMVEKAESKERLVVDYIGLNVRTNPTVF
jgi:hypothetical protein